LGNIDALGECERIICPSQQPFCPSEGVLSNQHSTFNFQERYAFAERGNDTGNFVAGDRCQL
jgi:hypothetical protein